MDIALCPHDSGRAIRIYFCWARCDAELDAVMTEVSRNVITEAKSSVDTPESGGWSTPSIPPSPFANNPRPHNDER